MELPEDGEKPANTLLQMQTYIARSGMRPIDRIVDVTNDLMLLTGQPIHAFDYDKFLKVGNFNTPKVVVRAAKNGEKLKLLDGKTIELTTGDIVICSGYTPVALAGAMGGESTKIDASTKRILVEVATFNLYKLRGTSMRHGIFSEAVTRFTKGQPAALTAPVIQKSIQVFANYCATTQVSQIFDEYPNPIQNPAIKIDLQDINALLGTKFAKQEVEKTLTNVGFNVQNGFDVTPPYWRTDIHIKEDIIEEIGRLNGFDNTPLSLPNRPFRPVRIAKVDILKAKIRKVLKEFGANEVLTYSFVNGDLLKKAGQDPENSYKIANSISPDLEYCRQSLTPSLLEKVHPNVKENYDQFALFEVNKISQKSDGLNDENVPVEKNKVALAITSQSAEKTGNSSAYYTAKMYAEKLLNNLGITPEFRPLEPISAVARPFENKRAAGVYDKETGKVIGVVGEYKRSVARGFDLPVFTAGFELGIDYILDLLPEKPFEYQPLSHFPSTSRDLTLRVAADLPYIQVEDLVSGNLTKQGLVFSISPISIYQNPDQKEFKNITLHLEFASHTKTLQPAEIADIMGNTKVEANQKLSAEVA